MASGTFSPACYRTTVGDIGVIALHDGTLTRDLPPGIVRNASAEEVAAAFRKLGVAPGQLTLTFTQLAVEMPGRLVLIDTGFGENGPPTAGKMAANLEAAGYSADDVATVLISHFHGDHISGLVTRDDAPVFASAEVWVPRPEWDFWMSDKRMAAAPEALLPNFKLCRRVFGALAGRIHKFDYGDTVVPGILAVDAGGHTPGMAAFEISSGDDRLTFVADTTNNPFVFARHPDWQAAFDVEPERTVQTRHRILGKAAEERTRLFFFHAPFPGIGYVEKEGEGYIFTPQIWGADQE